MTATIATLALIACSDHPESTYSHLDEVLDSGPFIDVTEQTQLNFIHDNGGGGRFYMPEIMGAGGALFDADNDGDLDLYLVQGGAIGASGQGSSDKLFRNDLTWSASGEPTIVFTDITESAGIPSGGYGMGVATGDIDQDGDIDLYVTNFGENRLLQNLGDGTFADVTQSSGTVDDQWSVPATFFDMDNDGDLDLYSGSYVDFRVANHRDCFTSTGLPDYCSPHSYNAVPDRLFKNNGNGSFQNISASSGIRSVPSKALGVTTADFNGDGLTDLYIANDGVANQLWLNKGDGQFEEDALFAGCALNFEGLPEASMGVDSADVDGDGDQDLFMTHLRGETNTLYLNYGNGTFEDKTIRFGLAGPSIPYTGFGTSWLDVENDGRLDLLAVNGAVTIEERLAQAGDSFPYHQPNQLFQNVSGKSGLVFAPFNDGINSPFTESRVSRGAMFGDLDNDGDLDVVITNNSGPARVLLNRVGNQNEWLGLSVYLNHQGVEAMGAKVRLMIGDESTRTEVVRTSGSYVSASDSRILFGLGDKAPVQAVRAEVVWPDQGVEIFGPFKTGQYHRIVKGEGKITEQRESDPAIGSQQ